MGLAVTVMALAAATPACAEAAAAALERGLRAALEPTWRCELMEDWEETDGYGAVCDGLDGRALVMAFTRPELVEQGCAVVEEHRGKDGVRTSDGSWWRPSESSLFLIGCAPGAGLHIRLVPMTDAARADLRGPLLAAGAWWPERP